MTLPVDEEENRRIFEEAVRNRPGDDIYRDVKPAVEAVQEATKGYQESLRDIILDDMAVDVALSTAIDQVGVAIEYHAQNLGIERPRFDAVQMFRDISRLSRLKLTWRVARLLGFDDEFVEKIVNAEIERIWFDARPKDDRTAPTVKLPDEVVSVLRDISKLLNKGKPSERNGRSDRKA